MSEENIEFIKEQGNKIRIEEIMRCIRILQEAEEQSKWSKQGRIYLELAVIKMCKVEYDTSKEIMLARINKLENMIKEGNITIKSEKTNNENYSEASRSIRKQVTKISENKKENETAVELNVDSKLTVEDIKKSWRDILEVLKGRRLMVLYASLVTGKIESCSNGVVEIKYDSQYAFNINRLQKDENRKIIEEVFLEALKEKIRIKYTVDKKEEVSKSREEILKEAFGEELVEIIDE
ncbi:MAG: DNA polymerase III subunit gamma/tau, partial [Clostridiaceae bacterium]